jgi:hypothetical protein
MNFSLWLEQDEKDAILGVIGAGQVLSPQEKEHFLNRNIEEFSSEIKRKIKNLGIIKSSKKYLDIISAIDNGIRIKDLINMMQDDN